MTGSDVSGQAMMLAQAQGRIDELEILNSALSTQINKKSQEIFNMEVEITSLKMMDQRTKAELENVRSQFDEARAQIDKLMSEHSSDLVDSAPEPINALAAVN